MKKKISIKQASVFHRENNEVDVLSQGRANAQTSAFLSLHGGNFDPSRLVG